MPTTVVKTIGTTGRDYSTLQAWEDAAPANLVTADQVWKGECYNDSEFTQAGNPLLTISGSTVDVTRYKELTAAAGQSFQDNASVRSNPLRYDQSKGVGLRTTNADASILLIVSESYFKISRLQMKAAALGINETAGAQFMVLKDCLIICTIDENCVWINEGSGGYITNCVLINTSTPSVNSIFHAKGDVSFAYAIVACTFICLTDGAPGGTAIEVTNGAVAELRSSAVFGCTNPVNSTARFNSTNCHHNATDKASGLPGTNNQFNVTYSSSTPFVNATAAALDIRAVASTALAAHGYLDVAYSANDISNTVRAATPTIGVWELVAAGASLFRNVGDLDGIGGGGPFFNDPLASRME